VARFRPLGLGMALLLGSGALFVASPCPPSRASNKLSFCSSAAGLRVKNDGVNGASGNSYFWIVYVNAGSAACVLQGTPGVQPVAGLSHTPVGPSSKHEKSDGRGGIVRLRPHGGAANTVYWTFVTAEEPHRCHPKATVGVMIHMSGVRALFVALKYPSKLASEVCTTLRSTTTDGIGSGRTGGP
jgi:hypothetical protein